MQRVLQGAARPALSRELPTTRVLAVHEAGHAIVAAVLRAQTGRLEAVDRVSIRPRGDELTRTVFVRVGDDAYALPTRALLLERAQQLLAGRAAEQLVYGWASTHGAGDLQDATDLMRRMVVCYSMGDPARTGISTYVEASSFPMLRVFDKGRAWAGKGVELDSGSQPAPNSSPRPAQPAQDSNMDEVELLLEESYAAALALLRGNRKALEAAADALVDQGELTRQALESILLLNPPIDPQSSSPVELLQRAEASF